MLNFHLNKPNPDIESFIKVIKGEIIPKTPPLVELCISQPMVREIAVNYLDMDWIELNESDTKSIEKYYKNWIEVYYRLGYDFVRLTGGIDFSSSYLYAEDTAEVSLGNRTWVDESNGPISTWEDFEKYPWPNPQTDSLWIYEFVANNLPDGMGLFVCPQSGFLEIPMEQLFSYEKLCYLLYDDPELVEAVFKKTGDIICEFYNRLLSLPNLHGFFQGDDMGYKSGTLIDPDNLRKLVLPHHKTLASLAHENNLVYLLHSCGQLDEIMDDLIYDVKIDGRHSFEDESNSVFDFKHKYGDKVAVLGGIDMDKLIRLPEDELRKYIRMVMDVCMQGGRFAIGSGNSIANYVPVPNYLVVLDEVRMYGD